MPTKNCPVCKLDFECKKSLMERKKTCSKTCHYKNRTGKRQSQETKDKRSRSLKGRKKPEWFKMMVSEKQMGAKNSFWKGGVTLRPRYKQEGVERRRYGMTKDEAIVTLGGRCSVCCISNEKHVKSTSLRLSVHHRDRHGRGKEVPNNSIENLELLCHSCHGKEHMTSERAKEMRKKQIVCSQKNQN